MSESSENSKLHENPNLLKVIPPPLPKDRSTKKARFRSHGTNEDNPPPLSFKDALVPPSQHKNFDDIEMENDWDFEPDDVTNSVVVKLLGRNIGYKVLCNRLKVVWPMIQDFSVIDLKNNYFLVRLHSPKDAIYALTEGPWVIFGHYLTVQPWTPQFDSTITDIASATVWIRLPGTAFHLYDKRIPLKFNLDGKIQKVKYEGLPIICYQCGKYGHNNIVCPEKQVSNGAKVGNSESIPLVNMTVDKDGASAVANNSSEKLGPWMIVARKERPKVVVDKENITDSERNQ
ncbi:uncharacterized protein LOC112097866 [Citrus clementina]|uniref:uncharacterized protein LOC112097866 n=1 Tax=Citrus clementina TaxID=85681 RepID=UPI000CED66E7|nr:uncharacterized protein LOC112097866 [Citrus x clementina]